MPTRPNYLNECLQELDHARTLLRSAAETLIWNGELQHFLMGGLGETPNIKLDAYLHDSFDPNVQELSKIIRSIEALTEKMEAEFES